jgi:hypothetical protein
MGIDRHDIVEIKRKTNKVTHLWWLRISRQILYVRCSTLYADQDGTKIFPFKSGLSEINRKKNKKKYEFNEPKIDRS